MINELEDAQERRRIEPLLLTALLLSADWLVFERDGVESPRNTDDGRFLEVVAEELQVNRR